MPDGPQWIESGTGNRHTHKDALTIQHWADVPRLTALAEENQRLREALREAVNAVTSTPARSAGFCQVYCPQIGVDEVDRWRAILAARDAVAGEVGDER